MKIKSYLNQKWNTQQGFHLTLLSGDAWHISTAKLRFNVFMCPSVDRSVPAGCHAGRRKKRRRSCGLVWRSCWWAWKSSPQCSGCGRRGLAGSVGDETWWALWSSLNTESCRPAASLSTFNLSAVCRSVKNKDQKVMASCHCNHLSKIKVSALSHFCVYWSSSEIVRFFP